MVFHQFLANSYKLVFPSLLGIDKTRHTLTEKQSLAARPSQAKFANKWSIIISAKKYPNHKTTVFNDLQVKSLFNFISFHFTLHSI